jgi:hypothetical protein
MKTKFNNSELSHVWANQTQTHGKGSSMFFEYDTIYSYGHHFTIAKHITNKEGKKCVFFNDRHYSNSTSKHQALVWRSIPANVEFFKVRRFFDDIDTSTSAHLENLGNYLEYALESKNKVKTATKLKNNYINELDISINVFEKYCNFFSIDLKSTIFEGLYITFKQVSQWVDEYRHSEEFTQWQIKQEENKKKAEEKAIIDAKEKIELFREFKISSIYANLGHYLLRYNKETDNVETSGGVKMGKNVFLSAYQRLINNQLIKGQHVGDFTYNGIDGEIVSVGCHKIPMTEIQSIVSVL